MLEVVDLVIGTSPPLATSFMNRGVHELTDIQRHGLQRELVLRYQHLPNARAITRSFCSSTCSYEMS